jgi:hypothetical protein
VAPRFRHHLVSPDKKTFRGARVVLDPRSTRLSAWTWCPSRSSVWPARVYQDYRRAFAEIFDEL